jgi:hypothetical protein
MQVSKEIKNTTAIESRNSSKFTPNQNKLTPYTDASTALYIVALFTVERGQGDEGQSCKYGG